MSVSMSVKEKPQHKKRKKETMFMQVAKRLMKNRSAMFGLIILLIIIIAAIFAPIVAPYSPTEMDIEAAYATPSLKHLCGTDGIGRDIFSRLIYGARYSISLGFLASISGAVVGVFIGALAGFAGGAVDNVVMRIMDIWAAIPGSLLAILISTTLGAGFINTVFAMMVGSIPGGVRGIRAMCLKEREMEYLEAATSINCSKMSIVFKHMLPNIISPTIISTTMGIGMTIMQAAGLAYIGLGVQPPVPEWGAMLSAGRDFIRTHPHMLLFPGLAIGITVFAINLFGDGLRDAMDPKMKK